MKGSLRKIAANSVEWNEHVFTPGVVEICDEIAKNAYRLEDEPPFTEWLGGTIKIKSDENGLKRAYHNGKPIK